MHQILLVSPDKTVDAAFAEMAQGDDGMKAGVAPLELVTLAALTPDGFEVDIWDEAVDGEITPETKLKKKYDIVGVTGYLAHVSRMLELRREFHRRGALTVAGGPAVSGSPERFRGVFDVICLGESEFIWPQFLGEWREGKHTAEYRQIERPDLADSPLPRWEKVPRLSAYGCAGVQTTRGCPFDCEFCDVIHLFGRKPRHKPVESVLAEVAQLEKLGARLIFFCDDNFIGNPHYARKLLPKLIELNNSFERPLGFTTQITINVAKDDEMLRLLSEANFVQLYVGLETPRKSSLEEIHKYQNTRGDMVQDVLKVQSYGMFIRALMMVGFDNDDPTIFPEMYAFFQAGCLTNFRLSMLQSYPGTPQTARLLREGRVLDMDRYADIDESFGVSNVIPARMTREELFQGYLDIQDRLHNWGAFRDRLIGAIRNIKHTPAHSAKGGAISADRLPRLRRLVTRFPGAARFGIRLLNSSFTGPMLVNWGKKKGRDLSRLRSMIQSLPPEARDVLAEAVSETILRAPWLLGAVIMKVAMQRDNIRGLDRMRAVLKRRLEIEQAPGYEHKILASVQIPPDFKRIYKEQFAASLEWLKEGLDDHRYTAEGLVRVWKDFVIRYGATFEKFEDYHIVSLRELVERTIEQGNAGEFSHTRSMAKVEALSSLDLRILSEQVMFSVEQDLKSESSDNLVNVTLGGIKAAAPAV